MLPASAVPVSTGVLSLVARVLKVGAAGAAVSSVMAPVPGALLPATSVLFRVTALLPSDPSSTVPVSGVLPVSTVQWPVLSAVAWKVAPPMPIVTVLPASAVPLSTGVLSLVVNAATVGAAGAVVSSVRLPVPFEVLPVASVLVSVTSFAPSAPIASVPETGCVAVSSVQWPALSAVV